jgi:hypothetical protein
MPITPAEAMTKRDAAHQEEMELGFRRRCEVIDADLAKDLKAEWKFAAGDKGAEVSSRVYSVYIKAGWRVDIYPDVIVGVHTMLIRRAGEAP